VNCRANRIFPDADIIGDRMNVIGLTGGIGMGKSTSAELLSQRGLPVVDTDQLARQVVEPGQPALEEIKEYFGADMLDARGHLRRDQLARRVFAQETHRLRLEAIVHPRIRALWLARVEAWRAEKAESVVVVIPLLFETNAESYFDTMICVACSARTQQKRLLERGWTAEQIEQRVRAQWPIEKKMLASHFVVWTEDGLDTHAEQLDRILRACRKQP
jgi:dephospho-CoA kinase